MFSELITYAKFIVTSVTEGVTLAAYKHVGDKSVEPDVGKFLTIVKQYNCKTNIYI